MSTIESGVLGTGAGVRQPASVRSETSSFRSFKEELRWARRQRWITQITMLPFATLIVTLFRLMGRYRIENLKEIRQRYRELVQDDTPLLICANHLTFIDSALIIWALGSNPWYLFNVKKFSWNLPAGDFFKKKWSYRLVALLSKCIFIHRDGSLDHKHSILEVCRHLLERGEVVTIFPEGRRSRSGRFDPDKLTFGVGKIVSQLGRCRVLCIYLRGDKQESYSNYPPVGSRFDLQMQVIEPSVTREGRHAYREVTRQIGGAIKALEHRYFSARGNLEGMA